MDRFALLDIALISLALLPTVPLLQQLTAGHYWRFWRKLAFGRAAVLLIYVAALITAAALLPDLLYIAAGVGVAAFGILLWRARPNYGKNSRLPPGSLWPAYRAIVQKQSFYQEQFSKYGPVFKFTGGIRPVVGIVNQQLALEVLQQNTDALDPVPMAFNRHIPKGYLRYMAPADHRNYRKIFLTAFAPSILHLKIPDIIETAQCCLSSFCRNPQQKLESTVADYVFQSMALLFFGVNKTQDEFATLQRNFAVIQLGQSREPEGSQIETALEGIETVLCRLVETDELSREPGNYLQAVARQSSDLESDRTLRRNLIYMFETSRADFAGFLLWTVKLLEQNPDWGRLLQQSVRRDINDGEDATLSMRIIRECLRLEQSEFIIRKTTEPIEIENFKIPAGWFLRICTREGHRNATGVADAMQFNPDRFLDDAPLGASFAPFGLFGRRCIGQQIVEECGRVFIETLARHYDWITVGDGPPVFGRGHWRPHPAFDLGLNPVQTIPVATENIK